MSDENFYLIARTEIDTDEINEALWVKSNTLAENDLAKAELLYVKLRVEQLKDESNYIELTNNNKNKDTEKLDTRPIAGVVSVVFAAFLFIGIASIFLNESKIEIGLLVFVVAIVGLLAYFPFRDGIKEIRRTGYSGGPTAFVGFVLLAGQIFTLHEWLNRHGLELSDVTSIPYSPAVQLPHLFLVCIGCFWFWFGWSGALKK